MTDFVVTITDQAQLDGITWAREQYNLALPAVPDNMSDIPPTPAIDTDEEYVQHVMEHAAMSYADQKLRAEHQQNYQDAVEAAGRTLI